MTPTMIPPMTVLIIGAILSGVFVAMSQKTDAKDCHADSVVAYFIGALLVYAASLIVFLISLYWMVKS